MRLIVFLFMLPIALLAQDVTISQPSSWIKEKDLRSVTHETSGAIHYLLIEYQDNIAIEESFSHIAYKVLNDEGVQSYSNISIDFDPSFQTLTFHQIVIRRNDEVIDKLHLQDINSIQRESDMNRHLYDGSITSYINLTDVRAGDIIEYSYTLKGYNPIFEGNYSASYYQDYTIEVDRLFVRILSDKALYSKGINDAKELKKLGNEYILDINPELIQYESNTPQWYNAGRFLNVSTYRDWEQVANWAIPLYQLGEREVENISNSVSDKFNSENDTEENIVAAIRFVQDEIRYLGFESGIQGYKPHDPSVVLDRRFGDCKDKSTLLVAILRSLGVEAYPMLVNTYKKESIDHEQASPYAFNHCVVNFQYSDKEYYVDPTINNQGGNLSEIQFPNYERGLIVRTSSNDLIPTGITQFNKQLVEETLTVHGLALDSKVSMNVKTTYYSTSADYIRSYFKNNSLPSITSEYTTFYSNLYPNIKSAKEVKITDLLRESTNELIVEENYEIENFWSEYGESGVIGEAYGLLVESYLSPKVPSVRTMPYFLGGPKEIEERISFIMPEEWNVTESAVEVEGKGFHYRSEASGYDRRVDLSYSFKLDSSFLSPEGAKDFLEKREKIQNDLSFNVTYGGQVSDSSKISWWSLILTILTLIASLFLARNVYNNYSPVVAYDDDRPLGGWLIVLAIGLTLNPFVMAYGYVDLSEYWLTSNWQNLKLAYPDNYVTLSALIIGELVLNTVFLVFVLLVVVVFYQRRTSAPMLISVFLISHTVFVILDSLALGEILQDDSFKESISEIVRSVIYTSIWVSYLHNSSRVKFTFTNR
ncbi:MAG: DUF3857 domain-containing protein [Ekhidna sp.]